MFLKFSYNITERQPDSFKTMWNTNTILSLINIRWNFIFISKNILLCNTGLSYILLIIHPYLEIFISICHYWDPLLIQHDGHCLWEDTIDFRNTKMSFMEVKRWRWFMRTRSISVWVNEALDLHLPCLAQIIWNY